METGDEVGSIVLVTGSDQISEILKHLATVVENVDEKYQQISYQAILNKILDGTNFKIVFKKNQSIRRG